MSDSSGVESPLTTGGRVPFRSVQNDMQRTQSTPSKRQSRSLAMSDFFKTTADGPNQPGNEQSSTSSLPHHASNACSGDITFKSFTCAGGEVLVHSDVAEDTIFLPTHQPSDSCLPGDVTISDSMIIHETQNLHMDHAYCNPEESGEVLMSHAAPPAEHSNSMLSLASTNMEAQQEPTLVSGLEEAECDVIYKSFICDGGEVEVPDIAHLLSETIPLPEEELVYRHPDDSVSFVGKDCGDEDHTDHPYSSKECGLSYSAEHNPQLTDGPTDITLKSFFCPGGEVELSDFTSVLEETIPLPSGQLDMSKASVEDQSLMNQSELAANQMVDPCNGHLEHCYLNNKLLVIPSPSGDLKAPPEGALSSITEAPQLEEPSTVTDSGRTHAAFDSFSGTASDVPPVHTIVMLEDPAEVSPPSHINSRAASNVEVEDQDSFDSPAVIDSVIPDALISGTNIQENQDVSHADLYPAGVSAGSCAVQPVDAPDPRAGEASAQPHSPVGGPVTRDTQVQDPRGGDPGSSGPQNDSALGMSADAPGSSGSDKAPVGAQSDVLAEVPVLPAIPNTLQFDLLSPVTRGTPLARIRTYKDSPLAKYLAEESLLEGGSPVEKKPLTGPLSGPWESPMPRPLFNSTALGTAWSGEPRAIAVQEVCEQRLRARRSVAAPREQRAVPDLPLIPNGPLQQQLQQIAELLMLASGKMTAESAPLPAPAAPPPVENHSVCVGTSPPRRVDRCFNTSGEFQRKREFSVADGCTATDPLLWNVTAASLEALSRLELQQRLRSSMIMVEALVQQLDVAKGQPGPPARPAPSQLRDRLVQTDHTELNQTSAYRDLYVTALGRIQELEMDQSSLQSLIRAVQETKITAGSLSADTDAAIATMKWMEQAVREDRSGLLAQYGEMKALCGRFKDSQLRMVQKVRDALQEREDMRRHKDEALSAKEAAFSVTEQLKVYCAEQMADMEQAVGCHQELMEALNKTYPEQVALNQAYVETLGDASHLLSRTIKDQASLAHELSRVRTLLRKTVPTLLRLNQKAADALSDRNQHQLDRDQALEDRQQIQDALQQAHSDLQDADQQIGDLNIQASIMNSELGVLREKLSEGEQERAQLERKVTELSANISSTLASFVFLEQTLVSESSKLQQSRRDLEQASSRADQLEALLGPSEQRVCELSEALALSEQQLAVLQAQSQAQAQQVQQLRDTCTQLSSVREMNEFLQMENEVVREQTAETEGLFQANLQGLRQRNIECEDLKEALRQLQLEKASVEAQLEDTRSRASRAQQSLGEQLVQGVTSLTVQVYTLKGLTGGLRRALGPEDPESGTDAVSLATTPGPERSICRSSFVDSVMVALSADQEQEEEEEEEQEPPTHGLLSQSSAFTRITPAATPRRGHGQWAEEQQEEEVELGGFGLPELLLELSSTVSELASTLETLQQQQDAQLEERDSSIAGLQREQRDAACRHLDEVGALADQLGRLGAQMEKGSLVQQQETQELRRTLQQSQVEAWALRDELRKLGSTPGIVDQKIQLLQEVERLREALLEAEQARTKLLEKAKRHKTVYQKNEQKMEEELLMLDDMVETTRKTLKSVPDVVQSCLELRKLQDYIS